jgi:membrane-bound metal-dependent hydrolase YbcI (DUF457 family)
MMGRTHALTGVAGACVWVGVMPARGPVLVVAAVLVVLGVLAPDVDHEGATRSSTRLITSAAAAVITLPLVVWPRRWRTARAALAGLLRALVLPLALAAHHLAVRGGRGLFAATATPWDRDDWNDGHRLITHTVVAAVAAGTAVGTGTAGLGYALGTVSPTWGGAVTAAWWLWGGAFAWGCLVHILGDTCTVQGTPLAWPVKIHGKRWWMVRAPITVHAGGDGERYGVVPVAWAATVVAALWMVGLLGPLINFVGSLG